MLNEVQSSNQEDCGFKVWSRVNYMMRIVVSYRQDRPTNLVARLYCEIFIYKLLVYAL